MTWCVLGRLMLVHTYPGPVDDQRFSACLREIEERRITHLLSAGVGAAEINSVQRKAASETIVGVNVVAIVDHALTRGFITAFSWLGARIKSYPSSKLDLAIEQLDVPDLTPREIRAALDRLGELSRPRQQREAAR